MNTVVSMIRFPPPPKPKSAMKTESDTQFGLAPATIQKTEQMNKLTLKANFLPIWRKTLGISNCPFSNVGAEQNVSPESPTKMSFTITYNVCTEAPEQCSEEHTNVDGDGQSSVVRGLEFIPSLGGDNGL